MKQTESKTSIIVLSYNTLDYTRLCLESICNYTQPGSYEIVVIDNGSQDGSAEWLKEQPDIVLQCNPDNLGFPGGCNQGMRLATGDAMLLLNSDTIVTPHWLENMRRALDSEERIGAVSCMTNSCSNMQTIPATYENLDEMISFAEQYNVSDPEKWRPWLRLVGFCLLVKRSVYARLGGFDEQFSPGNYEDDDFTLRIRAAGYELLLCQDTFIHHFGSRSFRVQAVDEDFSKKQREYAELLQRNWQYLQDKWQFTSDYRISYSVIENLPANMPVGTKICLVNCGYGQDMFYLASCQPGVCVSGVALHQQEQQMAGVSFSVKYASSWGQIAEHIPELQDYIVILGDQSDIPDFSLVKASLNERLTDKGQLLWGEIEDSLPQPDQQVREEQTKVSQKKQIVFLPYKAAMWDSLESIWQAADRDPQCEAYVMPIPYYDRNADTSLGTMHYEGNLFPAEVPILSYKDVDLQEWHPDVIYIHNPYDDLNYVTSIDPAYYSAELKQCTELLMYVPYYATSGGMGEAQANCAAYANVDYIVIQAEFLRRFFDPSVPAEKLIALGSPKFDRVIHMCQKPSEPPAEWHAKMQGKRVYFYNTSLGGMYENTESFLQKMKYVFHLFQGRTDACLLWRPHPLLESAIQASREAYYPEFMQLKQYFIENDLGIYDETPDIDLAIAWSDVYIGDAGTSVTSLFGVAGKPLFILNNTIHELPQGDDWRGEVIAMNFFMDKEQWMVTANNKLYHAKDRDYRFSYWGNLSTYGSGAYYSRAWTVDGKTYICPSAARDIIELDSAGHQRVISLEPFEGQPGAFAGSWTYGPYLLLIPFRYPAIIRYDTRSGETAYLRGINGFFVNQIQSEWLIGGSCIWQGKLVIGSPSVAKLLLIDIEALKLEVVAVDEQSSGGIMGIVPHGDELWLLPYRGQEILCWNGVQQRIQRYTGMPEGFSCLNRGKRTMGEDRPFAGIAFTDDDEQIILSPCWANMFVCLERETGKITRWEIPFDASPDQRNGYFPNWGIGGFAEKTGANRYRFIYSKEHRLYEVNLVTRECQEIPVELTEEDRNHYPDGFCELSESVRYGCEEGAMNTLKDLLDGTIHGTAFNRKSQLQAYGEVAANHDGTSGEKIHQWAMDKLPAKSLK